MLVKGLVNIR